MDTCVFCKIVRGEIPAERLYEDDLVVAFEDVSPQAPVHVLVIPKAHHVDLGDDVPQDTLASLFGAVPKVARTVGIAESGYRVIVNSGADANQTVRHLHVHVMGGRAMSHGMVTFEGGANE